MLGRLFNGSGCAGPVVVATLNARAQPLDRGDFYEDPLDEGLRRRQLGKVVGAGTMMQPSGEIDHCDIDIELIDLGEAALAGLKSVVTEIGVPKGSLLRIGETNNRIPVGAHEGLAVYLNGTDLPDAVYEECDVNYLIGEFERLLGRFGHYVSHWQGPEETALYLYGPSYAEMERAIAPALEACPLCQKARLAQIA